MAANKKISKNSSIELVFSFVGQLIALRFLVLFTKMSPTISPLYFLLFVIVSLSYRLNVRFMCFFNELQLCSYRFEIFSSCDSRSFRALSVDASFCFSLLTTASGAPLTNFSLLNLAEN